jgi:hypothetical protein
MSVSVANGTYTRTQSFGPESRATRLTGLIPRFEIKSVTDPSATEVQGRPIFRDIEVVELITPGNPYNIPVETVTDEHRQQWADQYRAFKAGHEMSADGSPLEHWPILFGKKSIIAEFKALNIMTIEHVRDMNDHACQRFMGGMRWRQLAKAYLDDAEASALLSKVTAENERKDAQIAELTHKVEELSVLCNSLHDRMQEARNAHSPIATAIPGLTDPVEQMKGAPAVNTSSALDDVPVMRRGPGRPRKIENMGVNP